MWSPIENSLLLPPQLQDGTSMLNLICIQISLSDSFPANIKKAVLWEHEERALFTLVESPMCNKGCWFCCSSGASAVQGPSGVVTPGSLVTSHTACVYFCTFVQKIYCASSFQELLTLLLVAFELRINMFSLWPIPLPIISNHGDRYRYIFVIKIKIVVPPTEMEN